MDKMSDDSTIRMTDAEFPSSELPDASSLSGKLLDGRYLILREIGRGGFGSVYLASDEKVKSKRVVIKVLRFRGTSERVENQEI